MLLAHLDVILTSGALRAPWKLGVLGSCSTTLLLALLFISFPSVFILRYSKLYNLVFRYDDVCARTPRVPVSGIALKGEAGLPVLRRDESMGHVLPTKLLRYLLLLQVLEPDLLLPHPAQTSTSESWVPVHQLGNTLFLPKLPAVSFADVILRLATDAGTDRFLRFVVSLGLLFLRPDQWQDFLHFEHFIS